VQEIVIRGKRLFGDGSSRRSLNVSLLTGADIRSWLKPSAQALGKDLHWPGGPGRRQ
jgi:hypothetical protein